MAFSRKVHIGAGLFKWPFFKNGHSNNVSKDYKFGENALRSRTANRA